MISLSFLFWATVAIALVSFWWQSDKLKILALRFVTQQCKQKGLQLLDQTMVLKGLWPVRNPEGRMTLRRRYEFEFTSTGTERYHGIVELLGAQLNSVSLDPHILPEE